MQRGGDGGRKVAVVGSVDPKHRRRSGRAIARGGVGQQLWVAVPVRHVALVPAAPAGHDDEGGHLGMRLAVIGDGTPAARRLADYHGAIRAHERQGGRIVDDGVDVPRRLKPSPGVVGVGAVVRTLRPGAPSRAIAPAERERHHIAALEEPPRRLLAATAKLHPGPGGGAGRRAMVDDHQAPRRVACGAAHPCLELDRLPGGVGGWDGVELVLGRAASGSGGARALAKQGGKEGGFGGSGHCATIAVLWPFGN